MDLFTPIVPEASQHQNFRFINQPGLCSSEIDVINSWASGFSDRDGKFVKEFQTTFNSSFWELYLFGCFKELDLEVNLDYSTPDFLVKSQNTEFVAEATTSSHPDGFQPEWERDLRLLEHTDMEEINRLSTIRLLNSISSKYKKYNKTYSKLDHVKGKPFVICVSPFDQPFFYLQDSMAIVRVLYAYDRALAVAGTEPDEWILVGNSRCYTVQKKPGVELPLGLFTNSDMPEISAIFFNNRATFCKVRALASSDQYPVIFMGSRLTNVQTSPQSKRFSQMRAEYSESLLDGGHVLLNPFAQNPLDISIFEGQRVAIHTYDPEHDSYLADYPENFLLQRACQSITSEKLTPLSNKPSQPTEYQRLSEQRWPEDELIYVGGKNGPAIDNHIAHFQGWTIVVFFDTVDRDWGGLAVNSICHSISKFMEANANTKNTTTDVLGWFSTKEEAYIHIKAAISFDEEDQ